MVPRGPVCIAGAPPRAHGRRTGGTRVSGLLGRLGHMGSQTSRRQGVVRHACAETTTLWEACFRRTSVVPPWLALALVIIAARACIQEGAIIHPGRAVMSEILTTPGRPRQAAGSYTFLPTALCHSRIRTRPRGAAPRDSLRKAPFVPPALWCFVLAKHTRDRDGRAVGGNRESVPMAEACFAPHARLGCRPPSPYPCEGTPRSTPQKPHGAPV